MWFATPAVHGADADHKDDDEELKFRPSLALSSGYATNPDEEADGEGSIFTRGDLRLDLSKKLKKSNIGFDIRGTAVDYHDLRDSTRWRYVAKFTADAELNDTDSLDFEAVRDDDALFDPRTIEHTAKLTWERKGKTVETRLRGSFEQEDIVLEDDDEDNKFDYYLPAVEGRLLFMPKSKISPFVLARAGVVRHPNQGASSTDRSGFDYSAIAGLRWKPSDEFEVSVGGRYNLRDVEDKDIPHHDNAFVDARLTWTPNDKFEYEASIERKNDAPSADGSIVADTTTYEASFTWKPTDEWEIEAIGSYEREKEIGGEEVQDTIEFDSTASYKIGEATKLFANFRHFFEKDRDTSTGEREKVRNTVVRLGVESTF
jgi:opacity protein-like surface antigen